MNEINILIVEDEWINSEFLKNILLELNYSNIFLAENANDAIDIAKRKKINIAFMDINIDGNIDGIQCSILLNNLYCISIVYISAYTDSEIINNASDTNFIGYIIKPFTKIDIDIAMKVFNKQFIKNKIKADIAILGNGYKFNTTKLQLLENNKEIKLTKKEREILNYLVININCYISYEQLKNDIWENPDLTLGAIRDAIGRIRKKAVNLNIENFSSIGYRLCYNLNK